MIDIGEEQAKVFLENDENVLKVIEYVAYKKLKYYDETLKNFMARKIDIFRSCGCSDLKNTTIFFCVKGSPNKLNGIILTDWRDFKIITCKGNVRISHARIMTKNHYGRGRVP